MKFAVFILSHKRADRVETFDTLKKSGYTGKIYIVVDDEDPQIDLYRQRFSDRKDVELLLFGKQPMIEIADTIYPEKKRSSALYARNFIESFAELSRIDIFAMMDDDITSFRFRWVENNSVKSQLVTLTMDDVFRYYGEYMLEADIATTSFPFSMFYISGTSGLDKKITESRHTYQIHIRNTNFPVDWVSVINQDTITQLQTMQTGYIWWSIPFLVFDAEPMNSKSGGLKSVYDSIKDFDMAFLAVISNPSCCKVAYSSGPRSTMQIKEDKHTSYPMIVSERYMKV